MSERSLFCQVNEAANPGDLSPLEQKHLPKIEIPTKITAGEFFPLKITVGHIPHPNENEHFIQWLVLSVNGVYLARFDFTAIMTSPQVSIQIQLVHSGSETRLAAVSRCNLHGLWKTALEVSVE
jgi:superoxide reductase